MTIYVVTKHQLNITSCDDAMAMIRFCPQPNDTRTKTQTCSRTAVEMLLLLAATPSLCCGGPIGARRRVFVSHLCKFTLCPCSKQPPCTDRVSGEQPARGRVLVNRSSGGAGTHRQALRQGCGAYTHRGKKNQTQNANGHVCVCVCVCVCMMIPLPTVQPTKSALIDGLAHLDG